MFWDLPNKDFFSLFENRDTNVTTSERQTQRVISIGVDESINPNDVFYSPKFIEKLERDGFATKGIRRAQSTPEDELVSRK